MAKRVQSILQIWDDIRNQWETVYASQATPTTTVTAINMAGTTAASATSLTVDSTTGILSGDYIKIGNELLQVGTVASGTVLNPVTRGQLTGTAGAVAPNHTTYDAEVTAGATTAALSISDDAVVTKMRLGPSALFKTQLREKHGGSQVCTLELFNRPYETGNTEGYVERKYTNYLNEYDRIRVLDNNSKAILFYGRIYRKDIEFDQRFGSVIRITAFDALKELADNRLEGVRGKFTGETKRSEYIKNIVAKFTYQNAADTNINLSTGDAQKFTTSVASPVAGDAYDYSRGRGTGLSVINLLADLDPHTAGHGVGTPSPENGYSFFVDNGFTSSLKTTNYTAAIPTLNYFQREAIPDSSASGHSIRPTPQTFYKLTYGTAESDGDSTNSYTTTVNTMSSFSISKQYTDVTSAVAVTYKDKDGDINTMTCYRAEVDSVAGTDSTAFDYDELFNGIEIENSPTISIDSSTSSYNKTVVGRLIYISATSGNDKFIVFTLDDGYVPEDIHESVLSAASKTSDFIRVDVLGGNTGSAGDPVSTGANRFTVEATSDVDVELLRTVPATFDATTATNETRHAIYEMFRSAQTTNPAKRADINIIDYPFARLTVDPSSINTGTNVLTLPVDLSKFGVRKGMVVRQLKSGVETGNYGYVSAVVSHASSPTITVVLNNEAGNATAGTNLPWAGTDTFDIYIPIRPGYLTYLTNEPANITADGMVTGLDYSEGMGIQSTYINLLMDNFAALNETGHTVPVGGASSTPVNPDSRKQVFYTVTAGATTPMLSSGNYRQVNWAAGTLTVGVKEYSIAASNSTTALGGAAYLANDQWYVLYFNKNESTTALKVSSLANLPQDVDLIRIAQLKASSDVSGNAVWRLDSGEAVMSAEAGTSVDISDISDGAIGSAKFVRGAQPFAMISTSGAGTNVWSSSAYNAVAWGAATLSYSDGDTLSVNSGSGTGLSANTTYWAYVDTTNGNISLVTAASSAVGDTKILVALIRVGATSEPAATIASLGTQAPAISTSALAANAIVSSTIASDALDAHTITLASGGKFVTAAGLGRDSTNQWTTMAGGGTGGGLLIDTTGIIGTSKSDDGDINDTEFYITASDGKFYAGGGSIILDKSGLIINDTSGTFANSRFQVQASGTDVFAIYEAGNNVYLTTDTRTGTTAYDITVGPQGINDTGSILPRSADKVTIGSDALPFLDLYSTTVRVGASHYPLTTSGSNLLFNTAHVFHDAATTNGGTLKLGTAVTDTNIMDDYGLIKYTNDGGGGTTDTLGLMSGQQFGGETGSASGAHTPATSNHQSSFWSMLSELELVSPGGGSEDYRISRLIFEPIKGFNYADKDTIADSVDGYFNYSYIGYHNWIYSTYTSYLNAGTGSAASPSITIGGDWDTGLYSGGTNILGFTTGGTARWTIDAWGDLLPANDGSDGTGFMIGNTSYEVEKIYAYTYFMSNSVTTTGDDLIVTSGGQIAKKTSSIRGKDNVETLDFDSSQLDKLRPVSYTYKFDDAPDIGLIAEEVNEIYPELINYDKEGRPNSVKYDGLSVMLLDEVKKLRKEVKELKEKN